MEVDPAVRRIYTRDFGHQHIYVPVSAEDRAQRCRNLIRRKKAGCNLVQHRTKQVVIATVDESCSDRRLRQTTGGIESSESATHDHYAGSFRPLRISLQRNLHRETLGFSESE